MTKLSFILFALLLSFLSFTAIASEGPMTLPASANSSAAMHNNAGIKEWNKGDYKSALMHFSEASKIEASGETHFNEAICLDKLGKHGKASMHFGAAKKNAHGNKEILNSKILNAHL